MSSSGHSPLLPGANGLSDEPWSYQTEGGIQEAEVSAAKAEELEVRVKTPSASDRFGEQKGRDQTLEKTQPFFRTFVLGQ